MGAAVTHASEDLVDGCGNGLIIPAGEFVGEGVLEGFVLSRDSPCGSRPVGDSAMPALRDASVPTRMRGSVRRGESRFDSEAVAENVDVDTLDGASDTATGEDTAKRVK
jgi:hypothetical protein